MVHRSSHRLGHKSHGPWSVQLALDNVVQSASCVTDLESASLDATHCGWANQDLAWGGMGGVDTVGGGDSGSGIVLRVERKCISV